LEAANARISSLEAELEASRKAWDATTAAKTTAKKSTKSALARAKKAEKALSDASKEHIQREQAVTEWINKMSALAGGEYHAFLFFVELPALMLADVCFFLCLLFPWLCRTYWGVFVIFAARR
jgi:NAD-specific glutamate dehydrogenase